MQRQQEVVRVLQMLQGNDTHKVDMHAPSHCKLHLGSKQLLTATYSFTAIVED